MQGGHAYLVSSKERPDCLSIIDPHRPENNISAGTHEIQRIVDCFKIAHDILQSRLHDEFAYHRRSGSLLEDILGGNFSAYELQRQSLYKIHKEMLRMSSAIPPPPPAPIPTPEILQPPSPSTAKPPQSVAVPARPTAHFMPGSDAASRDPALDRGASTSNGVVGVHFAHRLSQDF